MIRVELPESGRSKGLYLIWPKARHCLGRQLSHLPRLERGNLIWVQGLYLIGAELLESISRNPP